MNNTNSNWFKRFGRRILHPSSSDHHNPFNHDFDRYSNNLSMVREGKIDISDNASHPLPSSGSYIDWYELQQIKELMEQEDMVPYLDDSHEEHIAANTPGRRKSLLKRQLNKISVIFSSHPPTDPTIMDPRLSF